MQRDTVEQAWQELEAHWDDDERHRRFLELSRLAGELPEAGQRYRKVREQDPARAEMAATQIDRLLTLALQDMQVLRTPPRRSSRALVWATAAVTGAAGMWILSLLMRLV